MSMIRVERWVKDAREDVLDVNVPWAQLVARRQQAARHSVYATGDVIPVPDSVVLCANGVPLIQVKMGAHKDSCRCSGPHIERLAQLFNASRGKTMADEAKTKPAPRGQALCADRWAAALTGARWQYGRYRHILAATILRQNRPRCTHGGVRVRRDESTS
jgi:hypothetical protein